MCAVLIGCSNSVQSTLLSEDVPAVARDVVSPRPTDRPAIVESPPTVERVLRGCRLIPGEPSGSLLPYGSHLRVFDGVAHGAGVVVLVEHGENSAANIDLDLLYLDDAGRLDRPPLTLDRWPHAVDTTASIAVHTSGEIGVLLGDRERCTLYVVGADGGAARALDLREGRSQCRALVASNRGFSFARIYDAAPRVHEVEVDLAGHQERDVVLPITVGEPTVGGEGVSEPLLGVVRRVAGGRRLTVTTEKLGYSEEGQQRVRFSVLVEADGRPIPGAPTVYEQEGGRNLEVMSRANGYFFGFAPTARSRGFDWFPNAFMIMPTDARGTPIGPAVRWSAGGFSFAPIGLASTIGGRIAVVPSLAMNLDLGDQIRHHALRGIAADGTPTGEGTELPLPTGDIIPLRIAVVPTPSGATVVASYRRTRVGNSAFVVALPLRCG